MTNDETDTTMAPPWSMVRSSSDRRHGDMDDGDDDTDDDDTDDDTDDDHDDDDTDDDNDHKNDSYTAAGAAPGASVPCSFSRSGSGSSSGPVPVRFRSGSDGPMVPMAVQSKVRRMRILPRKSPR